MARSEAPPSRKPPATATPYRSTATAQVINSTRMLHKSLVRELAHPFNVGLFEYIGACVFASHG